jgi:hypothetical protein
VTTHPRLAKVKWWLMLTLDIVRDVWVHAAFGIDRGGPVKGSGRGGSERVEGDQIGSHTHTPHNTAQSTPHTSAEVGECRMHCDRKNLITRGIPRRDARWKDHGQGRSRAGRSVCDVAVSLTLVTRTSSYYRNALVKHSNMRKVTLKEQDEVLGFKHRAKEPMQS